MAKAEIPDDVTPDYENTAVREALEALQQDPDYDHLVAFLLSLRNGYLVVDVTGTPKKKSTRIRTIRSTKGQLVLPIFTSMDELRQATQSSKEKAQGAVMPAHEALAIIRSDRFVAAEFNPATSKQVMLRKYVELAAGDDDITPDVLEKMRA
jgi:hypothetical protein